MTETEAQEIITFLEEITEVSSIAINNNNSRFTIIRLDESTLTAEFVSHGDSLLEALKNAKVVIRG